VRCWGRCKEGACDPPAPDKGTKAVEYAAVAAGGDAIREGDTEEEYRQGSRVQGLEQGSRVQGLEFGIGLCSGSRTHIHFGSDCLHVACVCAPTLPKFFKPETACMWHVSAHPYYHTIFREHILVVCARDIPLACARSLSLSLSHTHKHTLSLTHFHSLSPSLASSLSRPL
jgi:hypothetical protein